MTSCLLSLCLAFTGNQSADLTKLANWKLAAKALTLTPEHKAMLAKNGFYVSPGGQFHVYDVYGSDDYDNLSSFITVDNVVDLYHIFFDSTLRTVEEKHLLLAARRMNESMLKAAEKRYVKAKGGILESAALKNVAYFGVAERLSGGSTAISEPALSMVRSELALIDQHSGFVSSTIFPYELDYSQFIVRGHYARTPALTAYFKTMMWYGLVPIALTDKSGAPMPEQVRQAAMIVEDLYDTPAHAEWNRIYSLSSLYAGDANDLSPADFLFPGFGNVTSISVPSTEGEIAKVVAKAKLAVHAQIVSKRIEGVQAGALQFRFMGQRAIPDSVVMNHLTNDDRPWISPLDIGAVLGSKRAAAILDSSPGEYNPKSWAGYKPQRAKDTAAWAAQTSAFWHENLYNGTLDVLRKMVAPPVTAAPAFMQSSAWADHCLYSALAGWAYLRHDTILYGEQTVAEMGDGDEPKPITKSYVEPNIALYTRLLALVKQTASGLTKMGYMDTSKIAETTNAERFEKFEELLEFFISVSNRELNGGRLSAAEHVRLRKIEGDFSELWFDIQLAGASYKVLNQDDQDMALVADVHTAGNEALEVAVGHADEVVAIVPIEGKKYLARGSALSFYEFRVPISERMTDHDWKAYLEADKTKPRPAWVKSFFVDKSSSKG